MLLRPPLFILIFLLLVFLIIDVFFLPLLSWFVITSFIAFITIFYQALMYFQADVRILKSLIGYPKFFFFQVLALLKARKANTLSVATKHENQS